MEFEEKCSNYVTFVNRVHPVINNFDYGSLTTMSRTKARPRGYKTLFMLNSAEQEILDAHEYKNIKKFGFFRLR